MKYLKCCGRVSILLVLWIFLISTGNYLNLLSNQLLPYFLLFGVILSFFYGGMYLGKRCESKGFLEGVKLAGIFFFILVIIRFLIFRYSFRWDLILYYLILFASSIFGSILGINKKIENK